MRRTPPTDPSRHRGRRFTDEAGRKIRLKEGREKPLRHRHPWVFSGAVQSIGIDVIDGSISEITTSAGEFLARAYVNRRSQIVARVLTWREKEYIDDGFWRRRLDQSISLRAGRGSGRFVNAESDGLPGLVVDRYEDCWVLQSSTLGIDSAKESIQKALIDLVSPGTLYERSDGEARAKEGLGPACGLLFGAEPPDKIVTVEPSARGASVSLLVDVRRGHKTGSYLDQRINRRQVAAWCSNADVLNLFSFTGGFGTHAAVSGAASVLHVDSSAEALELALETARLNGVEPKTAVARGDVFETLRALRDEGRQFDVVIVDPPKLIHAAREIDRGARAYKDVNRLAFSVTRRGGYVATFSCSGLVSRELFQKIVFSASVEAGRDVQIVERFGPPDDHPVLLSFPEGDYLKGLGCRVL